MCECVQVRVGACVFVYVYECVQSDYVFLCMSVCLITGVCDGMYVCMCLCQCV